LGSRVTRTCEHPYFHGVVLPILIAKLPRLQEAIDQVSFSSSYSEDCPI